MTNPLSHDSSFSNFTSSLPDDVRDTLVACVKVRTCRTGQYVYAQGVPADAIYFLLNGAVHLFDQDFDTYAILSDGDSFGESETLRNASYSATAIAMRDTQLGVLEKRALDSLLATHSALALAFTHLLAQKLRRSQNYAAQAMGLHASASQSKRRVQPLIVVGVLGVFLVSIVLSATILILAATSLRVEGLSPDAPALSLSSRSERLRPTKVARWVDSSAASPTTTARATASPQNIPAATETHIVAAGETLSGIAQIHGTSLAMIRALNNLERDLIRVNDQLSVPFSNQLPRVVAAVPAATRTPRPQPTPNVVPIAAPALAMPVAPPALPREWNMPAWTSVEDANVTSGQKYFRLVKAIYFAEASAGGRVNILVGVLDENGKELADIPVRMEWGAGEYTTRKTEDKRDPFLIPYNLNLIAAHDMAGGSSFSPDRGERGGYRVSVQDTPSDVVTGMGLPLRRHVAFLLVFQRTTR